MTENTKDAVERVLEGVHYATLTPEAGPLCLDIADCATILAHIATLEAEVAEADDYAKLAVQDRDRHRDAWLSARARVAELEAVVKAIRPEWMEYRDRVAELEEALREAISVAWNRIGDKQSVLEKFRDMLNREET